MHCLTILRLTIIIIGKSVSSGKSIPIPNNNIPIAKLNESNAITNLYLPIFLKKVSENIAIDCPIVEINISKIANSAFSISETPKNELIY